LRKNELMKLDYAISSFACFPHSAKTVDGPDFDFPIFDKNHRSADFIGFSIVEMKEIKDDRETHKDLFLLTFSARTQQKFKTRRAGAKSRQMRAFHLHIAKYHKQAD
jgi:hypothetical protein